MAERNIDAINKILAENGQKPLENESANENVNNDAAAGKTDTTNTTQTDTSTDPTKQKEDQQEKEKVDDPKTKKPELTDDELLEQLSKRGVTARSLSELSVKNETEKEPTEEEREASKLAYGLSKGLFNKAEYDRFIAAQNNPEDIVYKQFYQEAKKEDPDLTDAEIQEEFDTKFSLNEPADSRKFKRGQKEINAIADQIFKNSFKKIYDVDAAYSDHEKAESARKATEKVILSETPKYKKAVDEIFTTDLTHIQVKGFSIPVPPDEAQKIKDNLFNPDFMAQRISGKWTKEELKEIAMVGLLKNNVEYFMDVYAKQYHEKHKKGTHGIVPLDNNKKPEGDKKLTPQQQDLVETYGTKTVNN